MKKTTALRRLLENPGAVIIPPAYDCLSARVAEAAGFKAVLMAAGLTGDALLGMPNLGLATASEIINCAKYIAHSVNIPLIVGVEDGWGGALASYRTVQEVIPGRCGRVVHKRPETPQTSEGASQPRRCASPG